MNGLSKRLVSLTMATAMVFSLTAVPAAEAKAATASITSKTTSVQVDKTYTYKIKASKAKKVKVSVSGTAAKAVTVNGKKATSGSNTITLKGGKTLTVKVKVKPTKTVAGKKFTVNYKLDKAKTVKTKSIKVNYSTKGVTLDQTAVSLKTGETATLKATMTTEGSNSTIKSWVSSDEKVATVNNGVVTAVAAGTADITVTTSNGKTAKATVTVEDEKKVDEVPQMTALTAAAADTLKATFASSVPANEAITITRSKSTAGFTGIATWNADRTELTYKLDTNLVEDVYTMTVKVGESSTSLTYEATARKATTIEILGDTALTNANKKEAYVYYDVKDQYGESVRTSTSVSITSSTSKQSASRSTGKITVKPADANAAFKFGDIISVTIVDTKNGLSQSKVLNVGLEQQPDSVVVAGFVNKDEPAKLLDRLPKNFAVGKYYVLYQAKDQQGNILDNNSKRLSAGDKLLTVTVNDPMLIKPDFTDDGNTFTVDGVTYDSFKVEPGQYSDKGGETVLTIISNKTGTKTAYTAIVEDAGILKSLVLNAPSETFADGEDTKLTYTAKDTKDNDITSFESIVRSTNKLNLSASVGTLTLAEGNDGEAIVKYADDKGNRTLDDGIDQPVVLTTVVVGGETNNMQFGISDYAYPVAFKEINTNRKTNTIVVDGSETIDFEDSLQDGHVQYIDQYGRTFPSHINVFNRMSALNADEKFHTGLAIVMDTAGVVSGNGTDSFGLDEKVIVPGKNDAEVTISSTKEANSSVRFYIGATDYNKKDEKTYEKLNAAGPMKTITYTAVPYAKVKNITIDSIKTLRVEDMYSDYANLADYTSKEGKDPVSGNSVLETTVKNDRYVTVVGNANNEKVYIPKSAWQIRKLKNTPQFTVDGKGRIDTVKGLKLSDLYKTSTSTGDRVSKDVTLQLEVNPTKDVVETTVSISDALRTATTIKFYDGWKTELKDKAVVDPTLMDISFDDNGDRNWKDGAGNSVRNLKFGSDSLDYKDYIVIKVFDQYGDQIAYDGLGKAKITISNLKENAGELAHKSNSLAVANNNTRDARVTGAEIKDVFTFTVSLGNAKASLEVTVGGDQAANTGSADYTTTQIPTLDNNGNYVNDWILRKHVLGYIDR